MNPFEALNIDLPSPETLRTSLAKKLTSAIAPLAGDQRSYGLLDCPGHWNIGDSAIWMGEVELLRKLHGRPPSYTSHMRYSPGEPGRILPEDAIIYFHGGGNLGDIWPHYQLYRDAVIAKHPQHRIVQLPQSIHFREPAAIERTRRAIGSHRDFHLMVRDAESAEFARQNFDCPVILAPDSAFAIDMHAVRRLAAPNGVVALLRTDKERRDDATAGKAQLEAVGARVTDWRRPSRPRYFAERALLGLGMALPFAAAQGLRRSGFDAMSEARVAHGFAQLDAAKILVTDRLHGHILASLLGKPHVVIDNSYGKITRFIAAWGHDSQTIQTHDFDSAVKIAREFSTFS